METEILHRLLGQSAPVEPVRLHRATLQRLSPGHVRVVAALVGRSPLVVIEGAAGERLGPTHEAANSVAGAVLVLRSATNWLEDTDQFEVAHQLLDDAGLYRRSHYPEQCLLEFGDEGYAVTCPASPAHNRVGLSVGYTVREAECSICRQDPEDCEHRVGVTYARELRHRIITKADLLEGSLVVRPAFPDARIGRIGITYTELQDKLGDDFCPGMPVTCDRCFQPCAGVSHPFEQSFCGVV